MSVNDFNDDPFGESFESLALTPPPRVEVKVPPVPPVAPPVVVTPSLAPVVKPSVASEAPKVAAASASAPPVVTPSGAKDSSAATVVPLGGPVAGGKRVPIVAAPPIPAWEDPSLQDVGDGAVDGEVDYTDLMTLNRDLLRQRQRMARVRREMRRSAREAVEAKVIYRRALRRELVQQSGGTAESRKAMAEILCEALEVVSVMADQVADEHSVLFRNVRDDIENAKVVAYNLRAISNI